MGRQELRLLGNSQGGDVQCTLTREIWKDRAQLFAQLSAPIFYTCSWELLDRSLNDLFHVMIKNVK